MYRVVIKQLQLSFLSVLANISLSVLDIVPRLSFPVFLRLSYSLFIFLSSRVSLSLLPLPSTLSSFWTLSRCACGNFPGVIFAALLARSLTSLSSVFTPVVIFLSFLPLPLPSPLPSSHQGSAAPSPYFPPLFIFPSSLAFSRATSSDIAHVFPRARLSFPFPFSFFFFYYRI